MAIAGVKMVTDRSIADVHYAKSLIKKGVKRMIEDGTINEFLSGLKGAYNYTDINRVESAVHYLDNALVDADEHIRDNADFLGVAFDSFFAVPYNPKDYGSIATKRDWTQWDTFSKDDRNRYISNIRHIVKSMLDEPVGFPQMLDRLDYEGANLIERTLEKINEMLESFSTAKIKLLENTSSAWTYSGELFGGEI